MNKPKIYPDGLAELRKESAGEKYRPSNGTEGEFFMRAWCYQCTNWTYEDGCQIHRETMMYDVDEPGYPAEWRIGPDGQPECAAFGAKTCA